MRLAFVLVLALASPSAAHAGSYLSFGVGSESRPSADVAAQFDPDAVSAVRLALGYRAGPLALEAGLLATGVRQDQSEAVAATTARAATASVDLKYYLGLIGGLEAYARGGLSKTWQGGGDDLIESTGRVYDLGGGLQFTFGPLPVGRAAIWLDYTHRTGTLGGGRALPLAVARDVVSLGVLVGF